ncbi:hypothetical protein H5159_00830 [Pseudoalteromonas sp. SG43-1]|uniref:hypothetical protein n=1 Tax=Pseudoalteromonas sp. SG43-1 TaxID=2760971 RepID=UPI001601254F|nr:hypothetical protein [Pseudoalteromonas sp. SG43-1]MBB1449632.1 hypothetical protein [Pseudoalteromonas sp. SG43-1]
MKSLKNIIYFILISRVFYCLFAIFVYSKFSQLGDTSGYLEGAYLYRNDFTSTAYLMSLIGSTLGNFGSALLSILISTFSIVFLYLKLEPYLSSNGRRFFLFITITPSFGMWTSVYSKECILLLFFSLAVGLLIDLCERKKISLIRLVIVFAIVTFMKPHYSISLYLTLLVIYLDRSGVEGLYLLVLTIICSALACFFAWYLSDTVYEYTQLLSNSYFVNGASTRENDFWLEQYDFFLYAPVGIVKSFIGPTLFEAVNRIMFMPYFLEGLFIFTSLVVFSYKSVFYKNKLNVFHLAIFLSFTLVLIFSHYPVGIMNPGSSIRYRSGFVFPMICFILFIASNKYRCIAGRKD